jgi:hypothetical protein
MPHLVQMQKKYGPQGFAVVTVATDDPKDEKVRASTLKFLNKINASGFTNLVLDEDEKIWTKKLGFAGIPYMFLFNREGRYKRFEPGDIDEGYANVDKIVAEWLKAPASPSGEAAVPKLDKPKTELPAVEIKSVTKAGLSEEIAHHKGKVVLLNFWAFL